MNSIEFSLESPISFALPLSIFLQLGAPSSVKLRAISPSKRRNAPFSSTLSSTLDRILGISPPNASCESIEQDFPPLIFLQAKEGKSEAPISAIAPLEIFNLWRKKKKIMTGLNKKILLDSLHPTATLLFEDECSVDHLQTLLNSPPPAKRQRKSGQPPPATPSHPETAATSSSSSSKSRNFICSVEGCGKRFRRLDHAKRHEMIHTQETPFDCALCEMSFNREDVLSQHEKTQRHLERSLFHKMKTQDLSMKDITKMLAPFS